MACCSAWSLDTTARVVAILMLMAPLSACTDGGVSGIPRSFSYDPQSRVFDLVFDPSPSATLPTEVYLPASRHYGDGWSLSGCEESNGCSSNWNADTEILEILTPNQTARVEL